MKTILLSSYLKLAYTFLIMSIFLVSTISSYAQGAGNALVFDGNDNVVLVPSSSGGDLNPLDSITLECWIYLNEEPSVTHRPHFLTKTGSYALIIENNGLPKFYIHDDSWYYSTGTTVMVANKWYHIAGTYDGENIKIYVNGKLDGTPFQHAGSMVLSQNDLKIGNRLENEEALNGSMDEIRGWTSTRSESEIQESMNKILIGDVTKLVGYWRLDETTGTVAIDTSGLGNDGTLTNMVPETSRILSSAPVGDASIYSVSGDITETTECEVDVIFGTDEDSPGNGYSLAAIQVNGPPNDATGLTNIADTYWELWSENKLFDGVFSATVKFHYDNISGIDDETQLELFRRDSASSSFWNKVNGYTIVSDDDGSSSTTDGIGYVQMAISQDTIGGFSGQYILSGSNTLDVIEFTDIFEIKLFPNPNKGSFSVEMILSESQDIEIQVLSINGKMVWNKRYGNQVGNKRYPINLEEQAKGIYIMNILTKTGQVNKRIIIQ